MHLVFATRGRQESVDLFTSFLKTQMFPWKRRNLKTNMYEWQLVQGALRPLQLWEYVFPEESLDEVLSLLKINENMSRWGSKISQIKQFLVRNAIDSNIEPIPEYTQTSTGMRHVPLEGVALYPLGIKRDVRQAWEEIGYEQEML